MVILYHLVTPAPPNPPTRPSSADFILKGGVEPSVLLPRERTPSKGAVKRCKKPDDSLGALLSGEAPMARQTQNKDKHPFHIFPYKKTPLESIPKA